MNKPTRKLATIYQEGCLFNGMFCDSGTLPCLLVNLKRFVETRFIERFKRAPPSEKLGCLLNLPIVNRCPTGYGQPNCSLGLTSVKIQ